MIFEKSYSVFATLVLRDEASDSKSVKSYVEMSSHILCGHEKKNPTINSHIPTKSICPDKFENTKFVDAV